MENVSNIRDYDAGESLADRQLPHQPKLHQPLSGASLWVAVTKIPAGGSVWGFGGGCLAVAAGLRARVWEFLALGEVLFFMADHCGENRRE